MRYFLITLQYQTGLCSLSFSRKGMPSLEYMKELTREKHDIKGPLVLLNLMEFNREDFNALIKK